MYKLRGLDYLRWLPKTCARRYEIILMLSTGNTIQEISDHHCTSYQSTRHTIRKIKNLTDAKTTPHLIQLAHEAGIL